jgi:tetratricopeptide (TPR) repeat protein
MTPAPLQSVPVPLPAVPAALRRLRRQAAVASRQGDLLTAARLYARLVARLPRGLAGAWRVEAMTELGNLHRLLGHYAQAGTWFARALAWSIRTHGADAAPTRQVRNLWGVLCKCRGQYAAAAVHYRRALRAVLASGAAPSLELATLCHNLGGLEHARGRLAAAESWTRRAVGVRRLLLGTGAPETLADQAALAAIWVGRRRFAPAARLYQQILRGFRRWYGREHYEVAVTLQNLAALRHLTRQPRAARLGYRRALAMKERLLGSHHPELGVLLVNLGTLERGQGRHADAVRLLERAQAIFRRTLPRRHPHRLACDRELRAAQQAPASAPGPSPVSIAALRNRGGPLTSLTPTPASDPDRLPQVRFRPFRRPLRN